MDLKKIPEYVAQEDRPAVVPLFGPDNRPDFASDGKTRSTLTMVGAYSSVYRDREQAWQAERLDDPKDVAREDVERAMIAWAVTDWQGIEDDGEPLACTVKNVIAVFVAAPWVFTQARAAFQNRGRFFLVASAA